MTIILDAMGSDAYPEPELHAAVESAALFGEEILLVGNEEILRPRLETLNTNKLPVTIEHAPDVLEMTDKAVSGAVKKPRNSMAVGMELLKAGRGQAFVTAGNTGGVMFNGLRTLGRIKGVQRPALTALFPTRKGFCVVLDIGANADCRPEFLVQFAIMGNQVAQTFLKVEKPRVGLLSNGEEAGKGNQLVKDTFPLLDALKSAGMIDFIGNVEGKELFGGEADVVVCDGFTGNVLLKSSEAVAKLLMYFVKEQLTSSLQAKIGGLLAKGALRKIQGMLEPEEIGAVPLLGLDGLVFVAHGRSNARALVSAVRVAREAVQARLLENVRQSIQQSLAQAEKPAEQAA